MRNMKYLEDDLQQTLDADAFIMKLTGKQTPIDSLKLTEDNFIKFKKRLQKAVDTKHDRFRWDMKDNYNNNKCSVAFAHYIVGYYNIVGGKLCPKTL